MTSSIPVQRSNQLSYQANLVWQQMYSRGNFVLKASHYSRSIKGTSNDKKNLVASLAIRTEAF